MVKLENVQTKAVSSENPPAGRGVVAFHAINIDLNYSSVIGNCGGGVLREKSYLCRITPPSLVSLVPPPLLAGEILTTRVSP